MSTFKPTAAQSRAIQGATNPAHLQVPTAIAGPAGSGKTLVAAEIARLPIPVLILYGGHDTFIGADKIDQIITERNRLNSSITRSVMVAGAGYLEEYGINKNQYMNSITDFLNSYYLVDDK